MVHAEEIGKALKWLRYNGRFYNYSRAMILAGMVILCLAAGRQTAVANEGSQSPDILIVALSFYGPNESASIAGEVQEELARRLKSRGYAVVVHEDAKLASLMDFYATARRYKARYIIYGSVSGLGQTLSLDLRLANPFLEAERTYISASGEVGQTGPMIDSAEDQIVRVISAPLAVISVSVRGNRRVDTDAIIQAIGTRAGEPYNRSRISSDIKAVYAMGYFNDVRVDAEKEPEGMRVIFLVREKPAIRNIAFSGLHALKEDKIREAIDLKPYTIVQEDVLNENAAKIKALYEEKGYMNASVTASVVQISDQAADVTFEISEGERVSIKSIAFEGNKVFEDKKLRELMETTEKSTSWIPTWKTIKGLISGEKAVLKWDALERDLGRISAFYHNHGYVDAKVGKPQVRREGKWLYITIPLEEGDRYGIGAVDIKEDFFRDRDKLLSNMQLPDEEVFNQEILRRDILKLTDMYADEGFAYADIFPEIKKDSEKKVVNVSLVVTTGPRVSFERIEIVGNTRTRDKVIRRELRVRELEDFSASGLRKSSQRLRRLGYFEDVNLTPTRGSSEDTMNLKVRVKERPTGTFSIGAGYSSVDKLIFMGEISQRNFLGKGQNLSFKGILGAQTNRYTLSFTEPYFRDTRLSLGVDLYNWEQDYDDYTKDSTGGSVRFSYPLTDDLNIFWGVRVDNTDLTNVSDNSSVIIQDSLDIHSTRSVSMGLTYDTRNDYYNPSRGWDNKVSLEYAGGVLSGDSAFVKLQGIAGYYHPVWKQIVGHARVGLGYVTEGSNGKLPIYERFFLGGIDSVRGFKYGRISPIDPVTEERVGGERMGYLQLETIFPLVRDMGLNGVVFFDMGNVWEEDVGYDFGSTRKSVGLGIRWLSPMGPLRVEWGYNIDTEPGDDSSNWEFRLGGSF